MTIQLDKIRNYQKMIISQQPSNKIYDNSSVSNLPNLVMPS